MKRKTIKLCIIFLLIFIIFLNINYTLATDINTATLDCTTADLFYIHSWGDRQCIAGNSIIFENSNVELLNIPKIVLQSTDESETQWVYVEKRGNNYYFDIDLTRLTLNKEYIFKIKSDNTYSFQSLNVQDEIISTPLLNTYIIIKDNIITLSNTFSAPLSCSTSTLFSIKSWGNRDCIAGHSTIFENLDSNSSLSDIPKIVLQSTDGYDTQWVYVEKRSDNYYFDIDITRLDISKQYIFKVKSNNINNTYGYQTLNVKNGYISFPQYQKYVTIQDNILSLSNTYSAELLFDYTYLYFMEIDTGSTYLAGTVDLSTKHNDGTIYPLSTLPYLELRATDETTYKIAYVEKVGAQKYFFSVLLDDLDFSKTYYLKGKDTNPNNFSSLKEKHVWIHTLTNNSYRVALSSYSSYLTFTQEVFTGIYGQSGLKVIGDSRGTNLKYYKLGSGENVLFATFALHGYEDLWPADGKELTIIAEDFTENLAIANDSQIMNNWTIYIFPQCNPDGVNYGYTNNGPGRCTITGVNGHGVDMNRCWTTSFEASYTDRNYTGSNPFGAYEAIYLRDFLIENKSKYGQTILIDLHGWTTQLIGDRGICLNYFGPQFYGSYSKSLSKYTSTYGQGYLINWARTNLNNLNGVPARSALIELPSAGIVNHTSVVNAGYSQKYYYAISNMLKGIL